MRTWADLFTNRQLATLTTLSDLAQETRSRAAADGSDPAYADAIATYLGCIISRTADYSSSLCSLLPDFVAHTFPRQALAMVWDYAEVNPFSDSGGNILGAISWVIQVVKQLPTEAKGIALQADASSANASSYSGAVVATDPPYYDNVGYADLSDFFYVWLRRSLRNVYPELMGTVLTPKDDELVADPFRRGGKDQAERFFENGFRNVFNRICKGTPHGYPITVFYAFKQAETDSDGGHASTGWETLLEGMLTAGWAVTGTWPMRSERGSRMRAIDSNALASSIVLACRPRPADAGMTDRRGLIATLREEMPGALRMLEQGSIAPVDLRQAAIGPGMAVFSRYARVNEPDGQRMRVRTALSLINQVLDEKLSQLEGDVSADTRWCVEWFKGHGFDAGPFGEAETLSKGTDTGIAALDRAGVLEARAGKVALLAVQDISANYDPAHDDRVSEWKICLHLAKRLKDQGVDAAARLMADVRDVVDLDDVKELAYLLYSIAEKKGWAETALVFNGLGTSWSDLEDATRKLSGPTQVQGQLSFGDD
jgi:putative DNA methylase